MEKSPLDVEPDEEHREEDDDPSLLPHPIGNGPGPTLSLLDVMKMWGWRGDWVGSNVVTSDGSRDSMPPART